MTVGEAAAGRTRARRVSSGDLIAAGPLARPLSALVAELPTYEIRGDPSTPISDAGYSSNEAGPGSLFFCVPGLRRDGHGFAAEAVERGTAAIVVERWLPLDVTQVLVPSVREAMGPMSAELLGRPGSRMTMVGVTGTNGKTTTTYLLESVFRSAGWTPGVIGTTGVRIAGDPVPLPHTTPEAPDLQRLLARMVERGVHAVAMEVSSHGLDQHRVDGIVYDCAVFTNLTQDHLDYHPSMEDYFEAKARLFTRAMARSAVVNIDNAEGRRLLDSGLPTLTYGLGEGADVHATAVEASSSGLSFRVGDLEVRSPLRGPFNVENCLAALATARSLGVPDHVAAEGIAALREVPGRMETVEEGQEFLVIVDYAHTPDSIENVLRAARRLTAGRLIVAFGCGGDRDRRKRPLMGKVATELADLSVITSDNPRTEDPAAIIGEIEVGAHEGGGAYVVEEDRRLAIRAALSEAQAGDVVVIAGKGHETGQEFSDRVIPFDDRAVAAEELRTLGGSL
jgi:UDP-N-acetylmuramoyl-L-alanyl-D-glutamate--2,6-diaminopimelate ligase